MQDMRLSSVDLIYLDPPWNSNRAYNAIYRDSTGLELPDQVEAFCDIWELTPERESVIRNMPVLMAQAGIEDSAGKLWQLWMSALRYTQPKLLAYLLYMTERLIVMKGLFKPTGSIYLHCDPTASHYIKSLMDGIFGHKNFRNEIIWQRTGAHGRAKRWGPIHDILLFYTKSDTYTWNRVFEKYDQSYIEGFYRFNDEHGQYRLVTLDGPGIRSGSSGTPWRGTDPGTKGRHWEVPPDRALPNWFSPPIGYAQMSVQERLDVLDSAGLIYWPKRGTVPQYKRYLNVAEGNPVQDIISDIRPIGSQENERLGYPTQKPIALLKRIIEASSNKGDVVFDPFCGCATTICAAHELNRKWIGIDIAYHAIKRVAQVRLQDAYGLVEGVHYTVSGVPRTLEGAQSLWRQDKYGFQRWAVEQVNGFVTTKRTADGGIDGRLWFALPGEKQLRSMVLEVKGGRNVGINVVRDLRGALERDEAAMAGLIVMEPLQDRQQQNFAKEMMSAGMLDVMGVQYPRMQILSVREILDKRMFLTPSVAGRGIGQSNLPLQDTR